MGHFTGDFNYRVDLDDVVVVVLRLVPMQPSCILQLDVEDRGHRALPVASLFVNMDWEVGKSDAPDHSRVARDVNTSNLTGCARINGPPSRHERGTRSQTTTVRVQDSVAEWRNWRLDEWNPIRGTDRTPNACRNRADRAGGGSTNPRTNYVARRHSRPSARPFARRIRIERSQTFETKYERTVSTYPFLKKEYVQNYMVYPYLKGLFLFSYSWVILFRKKNTFEIRYKRIVLIELFLNYLFSKKEYIIKKVRKLFLFYEYVESKSFLINFCQTAITLKCIVFVKIVIFQIHISILLIFTYLSSGDNCRNLNINWSESLVVF